MSDSEIFKILDEIHDELKADPSSNVFPRIQEIDITKLSIEQMQQIESCTWLPDDCYVYLLRKWIDGQNENLLKIKSYLTLSSIVPKEVVQQFASAVQTPGIGFHQPIIDIFHSLGTGGGSRDYESPINLGLLTAECNAENTNNPISYAFQPIEHPPFISNSKNEVFVIFGLPSFLQASLESYVFLNDPNQPRIKSWTLEGSNDKNVWVLLDQVTDFDSNNDQLTLVFNVKEKKGFFRYFKLRNMSKNTKGNWAISFQGFDISGEVLLKTC